MIDGAKARRSAVDTVFDTAIVTRGQLHKIRNAHSSCPIWPPRSARKARAAYKLTDTLDAEATLAELGRPLDRSHPGAAGARDILRILAVPLRNP